MLTSRELDAAARYLEFLASQTTNLPPELENAPVDDEPETAEEAAAVSAAWSDIAAGHVLTHDEVLRRLGRSR